MSFNPQLTHVPMRQAFRLKTDFWSVLFVCFVVSGNNQNDVKGCYPKRRCIFRKSDVFCEKVMHFPERRYIFGKNDTFSRKVMYSQEKHYIIQKKRSGKYFYQNFDLVLTS